MNRLRASVITSSNGRYLSDLIREVRAVCGVTRFDLYVLGDIDVKDIETRVSPATPLQPPPPGPGLLDLRTATQILSISDNRPRILEWVRSTLEAVNSEAGQLRIRLAALATYFPEITSRSLNLRDDRGRTRDVMAEDALVNTILLAMELTPDYLDKAIVEIVCGTILDQCYCDTCRKKRDPRDGSNPDNRVFVSKRSAKIQLLLERLQNVWVKVSQATDRTDWYLSTELEPGDTYVINSFQAIELFMSSLAKFPDLRPHVGLNVDVAHMKIAGVRAAELEKYQPYIVHAHISDHPNMHTRDQPVGQWTPVDRYAGEYYPYLKLLANQLGRVSPTTSGEALPFSGAVALELEGCNRIGWIHSSLPAMEQLFQTVENYSRSIPRV